MSDDLRAKVRVALCCGIKCLQPTECIAHRDKEPCWAGRVSYVYKWQADAVVALVSAAVEAEREALEACALFDTDLFYLKSILGHLREIRALPDPLSLGAEVLADNIDFLDCFIDKHERKKAAIRARKP